MPPSTARQVRVEHTDLGGSFVKPQSGKDVELALEHAEPARGGGVVLTVGLKPRPVGWARCRAGHGRMDVTACAHRCSMPSCMHTQPASGSPADPLVPAPYPLQLVLPVAPPVALYGGRVGEGQLGLKFLRVRQNPWDTGGLV